MRFVLSIILTILLSATASTAPRLKVIYPRPNQQISLVDSTFILGNAATGSKLTINGVKVPIHKDGGWLAFMDVTPGAFNFHVVAKDKNDSTVIDIPVIIGPPVAVLPESKFSPIAPSLSSPALYFVNDVFEFSFLAPPGGKGSFYLAQRPPVEMFESNLNSVEPAASVFGIVQSDTALSRDRVRYTGYYRFTAADTGIHRLCWDYKTADSLADPKYRDSESCADSILTVLPEFPPLVGILSGQNHIVRTGPGMGYKLLYQPPGIMVNIVGMGDKFYKLRLASNEIGYINVDSVTLLPPGTTIPAGKIAFITVDSVKGGVEISFSPGVRLPYEINESSSPWQLDIDFFGATGSVDWIRYNTKNPLIKLVRWSQPQEDVFRMTVEIGADGIWGYKPYYDGDKFILFIRENPVSDAGHSGNLKGLTIVVDPGHSQDPGAVGPTGLIEADANLWISQELRKALEKKGAKVKMTRSGHENVTLYERTAFAESLKADLLISIHNNSLPDGINPFFNNGTSAYYYHPHSKALAESIHNAMLSATELPDHGFYYGNLALTRYTLSPAVLVECTFMILPSQEANLKDDKFQKKCANAILNGIEEFLKETE